MAEWAASRLIEAVGKRVTLGEVQGEPRLSYHAGTVTRVLPGGREVMFMVAIERYGAARIPISQIEYIEP